DYCVLEIGREEFISEKEKVKYQKEIGANYKKNIAACEKLRNEKIPITYKNIEMIKLFEEQKSINIYDVKSDTRNLKYTLWSSYDIDHIVPTSRGGTNSFSNKVITTNDLNQSEKGDKTPYEWLSCDNSKWNDFLENLKRTDIDVKSKKYLYLISPDAVKEAQIQKDLRATQYMEKIAKKLISLYFGWGEHTLGDKRRMFVCTGGFTAEVRRTYNLNFILYEDLKNLSEEQIVYMTVTGELEKIKKNRGDKRHHALDALVISFAKEIIRDKKSGTLILPEYARNRKYFENVISKVFPIQLRSKKPVLRETVYALRARQEGKEVKYYMVSRFNTRIEQLFIKISDAEKNVKKIFDLSVKKAFEEKLASNPTQEEWEKFLKEFRVSGNPIYKISMIDSKAFTKKEVLNKDGSLKTDIGEYRAMGKVRGQYLMPKEGNKGQVIYNNGEKWAVEQIYPFDSIVNKLKEFKEKYRKVLFWNTGVTLYLPNKVRGVKLIKIENEKTKKKSQKSIAADINPGKYKLNTISSGQVVLTSDFGAKYMISLKNFIEEGKAYKIDKGAIL
ncbi:type II CRISPR RNA-guided endonuclease Cas9, partial [Candidatus Proelusimicrobium excrementi]|uniref:type II CRISPR RNA-guided endonuclease Cas9 n=1 Tax=Candidatus Proelusimicrobium excrementi TaxID=3416222 RepID=UPI003D111491